MKTIRTSPTIQELHELGQRAHTENHREAYLTDLPPDKESPYHNFFYLLLEQWPVKNIVEVGVAGGIGTAHFVWAAPEAHYWGVDIHIQDSLKDIVLPHGYNKKMFLHLHESDSIEFAREHRKEFSPIDLLFLDGEHQKDRVLSEYATYLPSVRKGGLIVFDDLLLPGMEGTWEQIPEPKIRLDDLHRNCGFGVAIKD